jgi:retinol dehydrogenase 14
MRSKIILITGGTRGIGKATAIALAKTGASVIIVGRNKAGGEKAVAEIKNLTNNPNIELLTADLALQADIHKLIQAFSARYDHLDVLINNAGIIMTERVLTGDGIETQLAVNHFAPFMLSWLLLDKLKASGEGRIINLNSGAHRFIRKLTFDAIPAEPYKPMTVYAKSKLINLLSIYEMAKQLAGAGVTINAADPGGAETEMLKNAPLPFVFKAFAPLQRFFVTSVEQAAETSVYLATSPDVKGVNGKYFAKSKEVKSSKASYNPDFARQVWAKTLQHSKLTNLEISGVKSPV